MLYEFAGIKMGEDYCKNTIKYLKSLSELIPQNLQVLKSFYGMRRLQFEQSKKIQSKETLSRRPVRCKHCGLEFLDSGSFPIIKPECKKSKFAKKTLKKFLIGKVLTRFQTKYLENVDAQNFNELEYNCKFCGHLTKTKIQKPEVVKHISDEKRKANKRRKRKRKHDDSAELNSTLKTPVLTLEDKSLNKSQPLCKKSRLTSTPLASNKINELTSTPSPSNKNQFQGISSEKRVQKCKFPYIQANLSQVLLSTPDTILNQKKKRKRKGKKEGVVNDFILNNFKMQERLEKIQASTPKSQNLGKKKTNKGKLKDLINKSADSSSKSSNLKEFLKTL